MATITTHVPTGTHHFRNGVLAAIAALAVAAVVVVTISVVDSDSSTESNTTPDALVEDVSEAAAADLNLSRQGQANSTAATGVEPTIKTSDQVRAEFEAQLREDFVPPPAKVKTADEVRAEFEAELRAQQPEPVEFKTSDQIRAEFETELAQKAALKVKNSDQIRAEFEAELRASRTPQLTPFEEAMLTREAQGGN